MWHFQLIINNIYDMFYFLHPIQMFDTSCFNLPTNPILHYNLIHEKSWVFCSWMINMFSFTLFSQFFFIFIVSYQLFFAQYHVIGLLGGPQHNFVLPCHSNTGIALVRWEYRFVRYHDFWHRIFNLKFLSSLLHIFTNVGKIAADRSYQRGMLEVMLGKKTGTSNCVDQGWTATWLANNIVPCVYRHPSTDCCTVSHRAAYRKGESGRLPSSGARGARRPPAQGRSPCRCWGPKRFRHRGGAMDACI